MRHLIWILALLLMIPIVNAIDEDDDDVMPDLSDIPPDARPLVYGESILEDEWMLFYIYQDNFQVNVAWQTNRAVLIITRIEFLSTEQRTNYISVMESNFVFIMGEYAPYTIEDECQKDDISLYELDAVNSNTDYKVNFYLWTMDDLELWTVGIYFPESRRDELEETSELFGHEFTSCSNVGDS